jgi:hypothetical protein
MIWRVAVLGFSDTKMSSSHLCASDAASNALPCKTVWCTAANVSFALYGVCAGCVLCCCICCTTLAMMYAGSLLMLCCLQPAQVECEHQLSLERDRTAAVARQRDATEARLLAAEARAAALEVGAAVMSVAFSLVRERHTCARLLARRCALQSWRWVCCGPVVGLLCLVDAIICLLRVRVTPTQQRGTATGRRGTRSSA